MINFLLRFLLMSPSWDRVWVFLAKVLTFNCCPLFKRFIKKSVQFHCIFTALFTFFTASLLYKYIFVRTVMKVDVLCTKVSVFEAVNVFSQYVNKTCFWIPQQQTVYVLPMVTCFFFSRKVTCVATLTYADGSCVMLLKCICTVSCVLLCIHVQAPYIRQAIWYCVIHSICFYEKVMDAGVCVVVTVTFFFRLISLHLILSLAASPILSTFFWPTV